MTAEARVLERGHLPVVPSKPAPWKLTGSGYVLVVRMPESFDDAQAFVAPSLLGKRRGRIAYVLCFDYEQADCGPYQELMFAPGVFVFPEGKYPSISRIYVSTYDSVVNGRQNWGIPKDRADFSRVRDQQGVDNITLQRDGHCFATLRLRPYGLSLPVHSALLPAGLRTVMQHWCGKSYRITLEAKGKLRMAKLLDWHFDAAYFPDVAQGKVLAAAYLPHFELTFPVAVVGEASP
jgi:hypothetical protein